MLGRDICPVVAGGRSFPDEENEGESAEADVEAADEEEYDDDDDDLVDEEGE